MVRDVAAAAGASEALVFRYFRTKRELYVAVVRAVVEELLAGQRALAARLPPETPPMERLAASVRHYLDFIAARPTGWAGLLRHGAVPTVPEAAGLQAEARETFVAELQAAAGSVPGRPDDYLFRGYLAFCDAACLAWVDRGCPASDRDVVVRVVVGAFRGGLQGLSAAASGSDR